MGIVAVVDQIPSVAACVDLFFNPLTIILFLHGVESAVDLCRL
jgi:hypothetical protein